MTKKKFTINDVFKHQKQALLIATMQGEKSVELFNTIIEFLKMDLRRAVDSNRMPPDAAQWKIWRLRPTDFVKLTPYYKAFGVSSMTEMRELLMQTRRSIGDLKKTDKKRFLRRKVRLEFLNQSSESNEHNQVVACTDARRITPLNRAVYKHVMVSKIVKRMGLRGLYESGCFQPYMTFVNTYDDRYKDYSAIIPVISGKEIKLMYKSKALKSYEQLAKVMAGAGLEPRLFSKFAKATRPRVGTY